ncbi:MAG: sugar ABC transporter permease [Clostridia bacterium]|nr:sugar ABC transporter permease [Clostridia bacterium]
MKKQIDTVQKKQSLGAYIRKDMYMYILLLPALLFVLVFNYLPLAGIAIAFKDYDVLKGFAGSPWVGLENFKSIFTIPGFRTAIINTFIYSSVTIFGQFIFPILLAILINEVRSKWFKKTVQTISYLPHFLSWISVIGFAYSIFALAGPYNSIMAKIYAMFGKGYEAKNIFMESKNFLSILFFSGLWKTIGWSSVIYLAAICGVDQSLYEAADIDGCGRIKKIWHITLPAIRTTAIIILIMNIGQLVTVNFEQVYGFQNPYIEDATNTIGTIAFRKGIKGGQYSLATALGAFQGLVSLILVFTANWISKKIADIGIW